MSMPKARSVAAASLTEREMTLGEAIKEALAEEMRRVSSCWARMLRRRGPFSRCFPVSRRSSVGSG